MTDSKETAKVRARMKARSAMGKGKTAYGIGASASVSATKSKAKKKTAAPPAYGGAGVGQSMYSDYARKVFGGMASAYKRSRNK